VEKVWKAEQKAEAESKKIEQLRKELEEERAREDMQRHAVQQGIAKKKGERLDWMYSAAAGQVDHEMYLLGKPVDKAVDPMAQENEEDSTAPGASFMNDTGANSVNDLAAKVRDDPLFLIKKKEEEKRKELLHNPVKMKQLKQMLQANLEKSKKKKKDKKKKSKREKEGKTKRKQRHVERSDESGEETREIVKENGKRRSESHRKRRSGSEEDMHKMAKENKKKRNERHRGSDDESEEDVRGRIRTNKQKRHVEERKEILNGSHRNHHREIERSRIDEDVEGRGNHYRNGDHHSRRHRSPEKRRLQRQSRSRSPTTRRESGEDRRQRTNSSSSPSKDRRHRPRSPLKRRSRSPPQSPPRKSRKSPSPVREKAWQKGGSAVTKRMDNAEKEKRLAAMMENAKWRDEQRGKNVKRYKEEDERSEATEALNKGKSATFINDIKIQSFSSKATSSVSDRIRRNINSVQRTPAALESFLGK